jgi:hypothetical protein
MRTGVCTTISYPPSRSTEPICAPSNAWRWRPPRNHGELGTRDYESSVVRCPIIGRPESLSAARQADCSPDAAPDRAGTPAVVVRRGVASLPAHKVPRQGHTGPVRTWVSLAPVPSVRCRANCGSSYHASSPWLVRSCGDPPVTTVRRKAFESSRQPACAEAVRALPYLTSKEAER